MLKATGQSRVILNRLGRLTESAACASWLLTRSQFTRKLGTTSSRMASSGLEVVSTKTGPPPAAPYSQAIKAASQIWVSGQLPADENGKLIEGTIRDKTAQCCKNVIAVLEAGGSSVDKVVRVGVFLTSMDDFAEMNAEYALWFKHKPARTCVAVRELPLGVPVEIEAIAIQ